MKKVICFIKIVSFLVGMVFFCLGISAALFSCKDYLQVQQLFGFEVVTLPVPGKVKPGETIEIRCEILREGNYEETEFFLRYFQPDGKGSLSLEDGTVLLPNDLYLLPGEIFRLYYTSNTTDQQTIDLYFEDSFGQKKQLSFRFSNDSSE